MNRFRSLALAGAIAVMPAAGQAALVDLESYGYEVDAVIASFGGSYIDVFQAFLYAEDPATEVVVQSFDVSDPSQTAFSLFGTNVATDELSQSGASAQGEVSGIVQFVFEGVLGSGAYAGLDGGAVLVELAAPGLSLAGEFLTLDGGTITISALKPLTPIPLPATALLLVGGAFSLGALRLRRRRD